MVESTQEQGDGIVRPISYAHFRTDKKPQTGYSAELVSDQLEEKYYDDMEARPPGKEGVDTMLKLFEENVKQGANDPFLGTRAKNADGTFGAY